MRSFRNGTLVSGRAGLASTLATSLLFAAVATAGPAQAKEGHAGRVETAGSPLTVRTGPGADYDPTGQELADGTAITIVCQTPGSRVTGTYGTSTWWDKLESGGYVSDAYIYTGSDEPIARDCNDNDQAPATDTWTPTTQEGREQAQILEATFQDARTFRDLGTAWASLSSTQQVQQPWVTLYGQGLKRVAEAEAFRSAHIDPAAWDPGLGLTTEGPNPTDPIVQSVYQYYGELFAQRPNELLWAGLAKLAGGPVYGGIQDLAYVPGGPPNTEFVERKLLEMQKAIFMDLAWQHELYLARGIDGMRAVQNAGLLEDAGAHNADLVDGGSTNLISAWEDIASGDANRINRGNRVLVAREQDPILQPHYNDLMEAARAHMRMTSQIAESPVPGDRDIPFREIEPNGYRWTFTSVGPVRVPRGYHDPSQRPNIGWWEDRQIWVFNHMFKAYVEWLNNDPADARWQIDRPVAERAIDYRRAESSWSNWVPGL